MGLSPRIALGVVLGALVLGGQLHGQTRLEVVDPGRQPISSALVEIWRDQTLMSSVLTSNLGTASLPSGIANPGTFLVVKAIGFAPSRLALQLEPGAVMSVVLTPAAVTLAAIEVRSGEVCNFADSRAARRAWQSNSDRYLPLGALQGRGVAVVSRFSPHFGATPALTQVDSLTGWGVTGSTARSWADWARQIERDGFRITARTTGDPAAGIVLFRIPVQGMFSMVLADPLFGREHKFSFLGADTSVITFCPKDTRKGGLRGALRLAPEGGFLDATWEVTVDADADHAGGYLLFGPVATAKGPLLPVASSGWSERFPGRVSETIQHYRQWRIFSGDSLSVIINQLNAELARSGGVAPSPGSGGASPPR